MNQANNQALEQKLLGYKQTFAKDPNSRVFAPLADTYRLLGNLDEALKICQQGLKNHPTYLGARALLGQIFFDKGMLPEAEATLKAVIQATPNNLYAHQVLAKVYLKGGKFSETEQVAKLILALKADDPIGLSVLAHAAKLKKAKDFKATKPGEAFAGRKKAAEKLNTATMADLYLKQGHAEKALPIYQELLQQTPNASNYEAKIRECRSHLKIRTITKKRSILMNLMKFIQKNRKN